jgi:hypothetical protein
MAGRSILTSYTVMILVFLIIKRIVGKDYFTFINKFCLSISCCFRCLYIHRFLKNHDIDNGIWICSSRIPHCCVYIAAKVLCNGNVIKICRLGFIIRIGISHLNKVLGIIIIIPCTVLNLRNTIILIKMVLNEEIDKCIRLCPIAGSVSDFIRTGIQRFLIFCINRFLCRFYFRNQILQILTLLPRLVK